MDYMLVRGRSQSSVSCVLEVSSKGTYISLSTQGYKGVRVIASQDPINSQEARQFLANTFGAAGGPFPIEDSKVYGGEIGSKRRQEIHENRPFGPNNSCCLLNVYFII